MHLLVLSYINTNRKLLLKYKGGYCLRNYSHLLESSVHPDEGSTCFNIKHFPVKWEFSNESKTFQIVKLLDVISTSDTISLIMEYVDSNLKVAIEDVHRPINHQVARYYMFQLLSAVSYLHGINLMHRVRVFIPYKDAVKAFILALGCMWILTVRNIVILPQVFECFSFTLKISIEK